MKRVTGAARSLTTAITILLAIAVAATSTALAHASASALARPSTSALARPSTSALASTSIRTPDAQASLAATGHYKRPPTGISQWFWELSVRPGLRNLPPVTGAYPTPGSANIWDTDLFNDSNTRAIPTGQSPVVRALHAAGKYSICYVEAGAYQTTFPDKRNFAPADYGYASRRYGYPGYSNEWWFNVAGFAHYVPGRPRTLTGAAIDIAAGLQKRIAWCKLEGQDALEPDDMEGYTNPGDTGVSGGGWHLTRADDLGFERWLAYEAHRHGLAIFQKNDPADARIDSRFYDGMISEECNRYHDPCAGPHGDGTPYLRAGKPVLNAEYVEDGERTSKFCTADMAAGISGALFDLALDGRVYQPCAPPTLTALRQHSSGVGG